MKLLLTSLVLIAGMGMNAFSGEKSRKELKGDKYFFVYSFGKAIEAYNNAKHLSIEGERRLAESYHNLDQNVQAEVVYAKLANVPGGMLPEDYFNYAMVLKINGKYAESDKYMDKFSGLKPYDLRVKSYINNKARFSGYLKDEGRYKIGHLKLNTNADDFGPSYYKDQIVFASTRETPKMIERKYNWNQKPFLNMFISEVRNEELRDPKLFHKRLNSKLHDGTASFSKDGTFMAFTRNNNRDKSDDKIVELQIHFASYIDGKWSKPEAFILNNTEYSVGQPCLTADGLTMYFTSDMPGGYGGADIYRITRDAKGQWGKHENMGDRINTEGDELFPFYQESNSVLFFASNGHSGLGGLDIFICPLTESQTGIAYNAGAPLNTNADDFAVIVNDKMTEGYLSSNRTGGSGGDDLYSFDILKDLNIGKKISGIAKNKDGNAIPATFIVLLDDKDNILDTMTTRENGAYSFLVETHKSFKLIGQKQTYTDGTNTASTFGREYLINADVILLSKEVIITEVKPVDVAQETISRLNPIYFDLDKYDIRPDAELELDKIVVIMNKYPSMIVELSAHTDCRETKAYNQILSDKRASASVNYIKKRITKPERITGKGYGETRIMNACACEGDVVSDCPEEEHQKDRRTEFVIKK